MTELEPFLLMYIGGWVSEKVQKCTEVIYGSYKKEEKAILDSKPQAMRTDRRHRPRCQSKEAKLSDKHTCLIF